MAKSITLTKGSGKDAHIVTTTNAIEAENLKGIGYRIDTKPKPAPTPAPNSK